MSTIRTQSCCSETAAYESLADLCRGFSGFAIDRSDIEAVAPMEMPPTARSLLVHYLHMTEVLERFYGNPVEVHVIEGHREGDQYRRRITLTTRGSSDIVEYGVVRINLRLLSEAVRDEILSERTPLGSILIAHDVLRRIEPRMYLRIKPQGELGRWLGVEGTDPLFGRLGVIHCNGEPAIEVLEIVTAGRAK